MNRRVQRAITALLLLVVSVGFVTPVGAEASVGKASWSQSQLEIGHTTNRFAAEIVLNVTERYSSAEFGVRLAPGMTIEPVTYPAGMTGTKVKVTEKNGVHYFGFFDTSNKYVGSSTVRLNIHYAGGEAATLVLEEAAVTVLQEGGGAEKRKLERGGALTVARGGTQPQPEPGSPPEPPPTGQPGPGEGPETPPGGEGPGTSPGGTEPPVVRVSSEQAEAALRTAAPGRRGIRTAVIEPAGMDATAQQLVIELPSRLFRYGEQVQWLVRTPVAEITVPAGALAGYTIGADDIIELRLAKVQPTTLAADARQQIGNRPVLSLEWVVNGRTIQWQNEQAPVSVAIPYTPTGAEREQPDGLVIYYITPGGGLELVPSGRYHAESGHISFDTTHFSLYAVGHAQRNFADMLNSWAKREVEALAVRGIINGVAADSYAPQLQITRADFTKLLVGVFGGANAASVEPFADVPADAYYYEAVLQARALGLAEGIGDNQFNPRGLITRQDMMVLLHRAFAAIGQPLGGQPAQEAGDRYTDASQIAGYAWEAVSLLTVAGIVQGSEDRIRPLGLLTRAEAARVLYLMYNELY